MKAQIHINRHIILANKKVSLAGNFTDEPAIAVRTYLGVVYCKSVEFLPGSNPVLIQNAENPICSGATVWMEVERFESLLIDGIQANRSMFNNLQKVA
jgi:hypothetical protein